MCIRRKTREKARQSLAFSPVSKPRTHITYMLRQCTSIVYIFLMTFPVCVFFIHIWPTSWFWGLSWSWSYGSWIYNYLCNRCLSSLMLRVRTRLMARCTTLCDQVCQWLATGLWFSPSTPVSSTNKTDRHNITEILLKVALNTTNLSLTLFPFHHIYGDLFLLQFIIKLFFYHLEHTIDY
jgi:hypothetical protein